MNRDLTDILNLLHLYAERIDAGDFEAAAAMFETADVTLRGETTRGSAGILQFWRTALILHGDGTPRCRHLTTNPIIDWSDDGDQAQVRSSYTVLQATDRISLRVILAGRYDDAFVREDGRWRFAGRVFGSADLSGDVSDYLRAPPGPGAVVSAWP